jgi:hypothetical protein
MKYRPTASVVVGTEQRRLGSRDLSVRFVALPRERAGRAATGRLHSQGMTPRRNGRPTAVGSLSVGTPRARGEAARTRTMTTTRDDSGKSVAQVYLIVPMAAKPSNHVRRRRSACVCLVARLRPSASPPFRGTKQRDAYRKLWKDAVQYRAGERGVIYSLDLATAVREACHQRNQRDAKRTEGGRHHSYRPPDQQHSMAHSAARCCPRWPPTSFRHDICI